MIKIRLAPFGVKQKPFYRIVAIDGSKKLTAPALDNLGYWQPSKDVLKIDKEKLKDWVGKGAVVTKAVADLIKK